jgi:hypothetical protein
VQKIPKVEHGSTIGAVSQIAPKPAGIFSHHAQEMPPVLPAGGGDYPKPPGKIQEYIEFD